MASFTAVCRSFLQDHYKEITLERKGEQQRASEKEHAKMQQLLETSQVRAKDNACTSAVNSTSREAGVPP
jgi:hypothetical protein